MVICMDKPHPFTTNLGGNYNQKENSCATNVHALLAI